MGGTVSLDSRPGLGSVFTATVEVGDIPAPSEQTSGGAESPAAVIPATLHVLIVEDNPLNQKLLSRLIEQHGWTAEIAAHGVEAVEMTARRSFDLIFMDVSMPGMDGLEATRAIRTRERKNGEPPRRIVALTAGVSEAERRACAEAGMDDFLGKPFTASGLRAILQETPPR